MAESFLIRTMIDAARKAGRGLIRDFGELEKLQVSKKGTHSFVTSADLRAERTIMRELQNTFPDYGFLCEEEGVVEGKNPEFRWVIDPLDGTTNFMHGLPHFCISIALEQKGPTGSEIVAGVIFAPILNEIFAAEKGKGVFLENYKLNTSGRTDLTTSLVAGYIKRGEKASDSDDVYRMCKTGANVRVLGAAALELAYVAAGKLDAFWHYNLQPWDVAAGVLMVQEARGIVTKPNGGRFDLNAPAILASNGKIHDDVRATLTSSNKED